MMQERSEKHFVFIILHYDLSHYLVNTLYRSESNKVNSGRLLHQNRADEISTARLT